MSAKDVSVYSDGEWHSLNGAITSTRITGNTIIATSPYTDYSISTYPTTWTSAGSSGGAIYVRENPPITYVTPTEPDPVAEEAKRDAEIDGLHERIALLERQVRLAQHDMDVARVEAAYLDAVLQQTSDCAATNGETAAVEAVATVREAVQAAVARYEETHPLPEDVDTDD